MADLTVVWFMGVYCHIMTTKLIEGDKSCPVKVLVIGRCLEIEELSPFYTLNQVFNSC